jgi:hypothetical protein
MSGLLFLSIVVNAILVWPEVRGRVPKGHSTASACVDNSSPRPAFECRRPTRPRTSGSPHVTPRGVSLAFEYAHGWTEQDVLRFLAEVEAL